MVLKIISDGTISGTSVVDNETGKTVSNVTSLSFSVDGASGFTRAILYLAVVPVEIVGDFKVEPGKIVVSFKH